MLSLTRTKIFDDILAGAEMPPGVGIGGKADGHGEDGDEEDGNEQAGDGEGAKWGLRCSECHDFD